MWKKAMLLSFFHTLFLVLSKVMPKTRWYFMKKTQSSGKAVPEYQKNRYSNSRAIG